jgi:hypothetical protein
MYGDTDKLKRHYYEFPGIDSQNREAQALLRIALITVFEEKGKKADEEKNEDDKRLADAMIQVLFTDLQNDFQPKQLTNYVLVRLGDYLREKTSAARQALPYYKEVLTREDQSYRFNANFGIADIYGEAGSTAEEKLEAIKSLEHVVENAPQKKQKEAGLYRIVTILASKGDWKDVTERAKQYLTTEGYRAYGGYVSLLLGQSYENRAMREDAIAAYAKVLGAFAGMIEVSAPAVHNLMELTWKRNREGAGKGDRQTAYEVGYGYIKSTERLYPQMTDKEKKLWDQTKALVQTYEDFSGIEKIIEEPDPTARR